MDEADAVIRPVLGLRNTSVASETLTRFLQGLPEAEHPDPSPEVRGPQYHTGRVPNGANTGHNARLLLMGQRRYISTCFQLNATACRFSDMIQEWQVIYCWSSVSQDCPSRNTVHGFDNRDHERSITVGINSSFKLSCFS